MAKRNYTIAERALALDLIDRHGGDIGRAMPEIRAALNAPVLNASTVWRWRASTSENASALQPIAMIAMTEKKAAQTLDRYFEQVAWRMLEHALKDDVLGKMDGRAAVTSAAIAVDKMQLLRGLPTEIVAVLPQVLKAIEQRGLNAGDVFEAMLAELVSNDADGG